MTSPDREAVLGERKVPRALRPYPIKVAFADYDRTRPLLDGRVKAEGIALEATTRWVGDFCNRPVYEEFDAAEMSLSMYVAARDRGEPCIAIPIFTLRDPIWAYMYVRTESTITKPSDLVGKRIGVEGYRYTINLWLRGLLKEYYGFSPEQATWVTSDLEGAGYIVPQGIPVEVRQGSTPAEKLKRGDVDVIWCPRVPEEFQNSEGWMRRLFPDCQAEVHRFVRRTGILPMSHVMVMNEELAGRSPWIAESLYYAFVEAQRCADEMCRIEKMLSFVDSMFFIEQQKAAYGPEPYVHGVAPNRRAIETFVRYAHEQGYISRRIPVEELFVPATLGL